jgi:tetratricopeptide (TPR) repeat protein
VSDLILSVVALLILAFSTYGIYRNLGGIVTSLGWHSSALRILDARIARSPHDLLAYAQRASVHFVLGNPVESLADYTRALELDIEKFERWTIRKGVRNTLLTERAQVYYAVGDYENAQRDLLAAHQIKTNAHATLAWLAILKFTVGENEEAVKWWKEATTLYPKYGKLTETDWISNSLGWHQRPITSAQSVIGELNKLT